MAKYGIWNGMSKEFQFGIAEDTPKKANQKLFKRIGYDSYKWRFKVKEIKPGDKIQELPSYVKRRKRYDIKTKMEEC